MISVTVRPSSVGRESRGVLAACLAIVALAALYVVWLPRGTSLETVAAGTLDARTDLTASEQGIYADLIAATPDLAAEPEATPAALAEEALPPFIPDAGWKSRGAHQWKRLQSGWLVGVSSDPKLAGHFLVSSAGPDLLVWLNRSSAEVGETHDHDLIERGWKPVGRVFTKGVTR
jgi:hypothetical protein